jgi:hypothetical protein
MPASNTPVIEPPGLAEELAAIGQLLVAGNLNEARRLVERLQSSHPDSEELGHYARLLAPFEVRIRPGERGRTLDRERTWLAAHAREYPGCWLAVSGDQLIAADPDYAVVLARVRETVGVENAVAYKSP